MAQNGMCRSAVHQQGSNHSTYDYMNNRITRSTEAEDFKFHVHILLLQLYTGMKHVLLRCGMDLWHYIY